MFSMTDSALLHQFTTILGIVALFTKGLSLGRVMRGVRTGLVSGVINAVFIANMIYSVLGVSGV